MVYAGICITTHSPQARSEVFSLFDLIMAGTWAVIGVIAFSAWLGWTFHLFPFTSRQEETQQCTFARLQTEVYSFLFPFYFPSEKEKRHKEAFFR
jgi:hypothetical protein